MSNTSSKVTKATVLASVQALMAGTKQFFSKGNYNFGNATYNATSILQILQGLVDAMNALDTAQTDAKEAMAAKLAEQAKAGPFISVYKRFIQATFAGATSTLTVFGLQPPKARTPLTSQQRAAAAAKAAATRAARGTVGKKKKLTIKGNVTGITVTPVTSSPDATPSAQPAPATPPAPAPAGSTTK